MKLDDRPVIDQLLNPAPLNMIQEVHATLVERTLNREGGGLTSAQVEASLDVLSLFMDEMEARL